MTRQYRLTLHPADGLAHRSVIQDQATVGAGGHVEAQSGRVAAGQVREPGVSIALEVDAEALAVGSAVAGRALAPDGGGTESSQSRHGENRLIREPNGTRCMLSEIAMQDTVPEE